VEKKLPERLAEEVAAFAVARPLRLMFQDEARFGRISDVRHCWDKKPHRPMVRAMITQQYTYAYGAVSPVDGRFDSLILPYVNGKRSTNSNLVIWFQLHQACNPYNEKEQA